MTTHIKLTALQSFACLADKCPDNCCAGAWDIEVDAAIQERWSSLPEGEARRQLAGSLESRTRGTAQVVLLRRLDDRRCVHLEGAGLCGIHARLGADYLPKICREFPRITTAAPQASITSGTLACPELARLALFGAGTEPFAVERDAGPADADTDEAQLTRWLAAAIDAALGEVEIPLGVRIYYLARLLNRLATLSAAGELELPVLEELAANARRDLSEIDRAVKDWRLRPEPFTAGSFWRAIYHLGRSQGLFDDTAIADMPLIAALRAPADDEARCFRAVHAELGRCRGTAAAAARAAFASGLERYLRIGLVNNGLPWNPPFGNHIVGFISCVIPLALIQLRLWIALQGPDRVTPETLTDIVYRTERGIGHSTLLYKRLNRNSQLLHLDRYADCLLDIG
jgi:Fe-S-cluster containining protein